MNRKTKLAIVFISIASMLLLSYLTGYLDGSIDAEKEPSKTDLNIPKELAERFSRNPTDQEWPDA